MSMPSITRKAASSSLRVLFQESFGEDEIVFQLHQRVHPDGTIRGRPLFDGLYKRDASGTGSLVAVGANATVTKTKTGRPVIAAFVRDPVERFLSGYQEATMRRLKNAFRKAAGLEHSIEGRPFLGDKKGLPPGETGRDMERFLAARKDLIDAVAADHDGHAMSHHETEVHAGWLHAADLPSLFEDFILNHHDNGHPFDTHVRLQSHMLAGKLSRVDLLGSTAHLTESWNELLALVGKPLRDTSREPHAHAAWHKKVNDTGLSPTQLSSEARAKLCATVQPEFDCFGISSPWCSRLGNSGAN